MRIRRNHADPQSMIGVSAEQLLAMRPPGWLVRPFPAPHPGFRMLSPDPLPGTTGTSAYFGAIHGYVNLPADASVTDVLLNSALEHLTLVEVLKEWAEWDSATRTGIVPTDHAPALIAELSDATSALLQASRVTLYEDPLEGDQASIRLVPTTEAIEVVSTPRHWWIDPTSSTERATSVFMVDRIDHMANRAWRRRTRSFRS